MLLKEVQIKGNGKSVCFFDDHLELKGKSLRYDDIAILMTNGKTTIHTYGGIPVGRSFDGGAQFKMNNGQTFRIIMSAMTVLGIPILLKSPRKSEQLYPALHEALNTIVAKYMAQKLIYKIKYGDTVEIAGLIINSYEAKKAKEKGKEKEKEVVVINKENYRESQLSNIYIVTVYDKVGSILWQSSVWDNKNILLVPYILEAVFGE